jgi:riboflavin kinase / FMN adenylyltransferase
MSIGIFDGSHRGHAAIFGRVRSRAQEAGGESAIVTFWPHPRVVLEKAGQNLKFLSSLDEKVSLIRQSGIDHLFIIPFSLKFAQLPPCTFIKRYLVDRAGLKHLIFGFDHHFGRGREGNFESLKSCAELYSFTIEQIGPVSEGEITISSSAIREALANGQVELASTLLSYDYTITGKIIGGNRIGREIGFPTANIELTDSHKLVPADGVYAVRARLDDGSYDGMMNIGYRPTISGNGDVRSMEVHLMDFTGDLYNHTIDISFAGRIRDEKRFSSLDQLRARLQLDRETALQILSK